MEVPSSQSLASKLGASLASVLVPICPLALGQATSPHHDSKCTNCPDVRDDRSILTYKLQEARTFQYLINNVGHEIEVLVGWLPDEVLVCAGGNGGLAAAWVSGCDSQDRDRLNGIVLAHEIGHTQNIWHTEDDNCWPLNDYKSLSQKYRNRMTMHPSCNMPRKLSA